MGTSAAIQANGRHQSAQIIKSYNQFFLIDCGEGTQEQLVRRKINTNKIDKIFISHLHGDHFLGLFGLISTMSLLGRKKALTIYGPKGLKEIITTQLKYSQSVINYNLDIFETQDKNLETIFENNQLEIKTFPLNHGIPCTGFLIKEKQKPRRVDIKSIPFDLSISQIKALKKGESFELKDGTYVENDQYTFPPKKSRSYAYCSDTTYLDSTIDYVRNVDVLYHETTFLHKLKEKAQNTKHSTSTDAATIARKANVGTLIMGHFSARYKDVQEFETEAKTIFENSQTAVEGVEIIIPD